MKRSFSTEEYCLTRLRHERPRLPFPFARPRAHAVWRRQLTAAIWREWGERPAPVPLRPRIVERREFREYWREKVILETGRFISLPAWVLIPKRSTRSSRRGKLPALLAAHGHGYGKDDVVGETRGRPDRARFIRQLNYDYAREAVRRGYVVLAPDWRPFGERADAPDWVRPNRDGCDVASHALQYFGMHLLGLNVWDGMRALDYLQRRPEVDPARLGCLGLSYGGTITTYLTALDARVKVACISGYVSTLANGLGHRRGNFCGAQAMPGLARYGDIPDVVLLAAPRPLCLEIALQEDCFHTPDMLRAARSVQRGYRALGVADRVVVDTFEGHHQWSGRKAWDWFARWLG